MSAMIPQCGRQMRRPMLLQLAGITAAGCTGALLGNLLLERWLNQWSLARSYYPTAGVVACMACAALLSLQIGANLPSGTKWLFCLAIGFVLPELVQAVVF